MYNIDNATASTTLPAPAAVGPNPNGFFTDGNPATGIPATIVDDDWLNMIQAEIANVVLAAGLTLSKTNYSQLLAAIEVIAFPPNIAPQIASQNIMTPAASTTYTLPVTFTAPTNGWAVANQSILVGGMMTTGAYIISTISFVGAAGVTSTSNEGFLPATNFAQGYYVKGASVLVSFQMQTTSISPGTAPGVQIQQSAMVTFLPAQ